MFTNGLNTVQTVSAAASRFERFVLQSDTEETLWASVCIEGLNVRFRRQGRAGGPLIHLMRFESTYLVTLPASPCHDAPPGFLIYVIIYRYYVGTGETGRDGEIDRAIYRDIYRERERERERHVHTHGCIFMCIHIRISTLVCMHTCINTHLRTYEHTYTSTHT